MDHNTKQIARDRVRILFDQARTVQRTNPDLSNRYIEKARKIAMAARIRLQLKHKRQICRKCNSLLIVGESCRVRIRHNREPHLVVTCLGCGSKTRIILRNKKEKNKLEQNHNSNETPC